MEFSLGRQTAIEALLPLRSGIDTGDTADWKRSTYYAVDGNEVIVTFDGTGGTPSETVELTGWKVNGVNWSVSYPVDPVNRNYLRQ